MTNDIKTYLTLCLLAFTTAAQGQGTFVLWDESVNGPLSNSAGTPTSLGSLRIGNNSLSGMAEATPAGAGWGVNNDFFTFDVPNGLAVVAIGFTTDRRTWAWIGSEHFTLEYGFVMNPSNGDLMPQWGLSSLSPNHYGIYVSNNDLQSHPTVASYQLNLVVQPIPEPTSTALIVVSGMAAMALNCRVIFRSR